MVLVGCVEAALLGRGSSAENRHKLNLYASLCYGLQAVARVPTRRVKVIKLRIFPFALSLSKGERKNPNYYKLSRSWFDKLTTNGLT